MHAWGRRRRMAAKKSAKFEVDIRGLAAACSLV